jgi:hypothetical protein
MAMPALQDGRVVFNIGGNKYRIVVWINFPYRVVNIRFIGTHKQHDAELEFDSSSGEYVPNAECRFADGPWRFAADWVEFEFHGDVRNVSADGKLLPVEHWRKKAAVGLRPDGSVRLVYKGEHPQSRSRGSSGAPKFVIRGSGVRIPQPAPIITTTYAAGDFQTRNLWTPLWTLQEFGDSRRSPAVV